VPQSGIVISRCVREGEVRTGSFQSIRGVLLDRVARQGNPRRRHGKDDEGPAHGCINNPVWFNGKRMIYGGFMPIVELGASV